MFVVVPDLRWSTAPAALDGWAKASLALRTADRRRAVDVDLTIGKGRRTGGPGAVPDAGPLDRSGDGVALRQWPALLGHDRRLRFGGHLGELGQQLVDHGVAYAVVGERSSGATAAALGADHAGRVRRFIVGGAAEAGATLRDAALVMVDSEGADVDAVLQATTGACRVVAGGSLPDDASHLAAIAVSPECGLGRGGLTSPSTRRAGFVTLPDLAPTLLSLVGLRPPDIFEGGAVRSAPAVSRSQLIDEDRRAAVSQDAGKPFATAFALAAALGLVGLVWERARPAVAGVLLGMPAALLLMMLVPWWRAAAGSDGGALHTGRGSSPASPCSSGSPGCWRPPPDGWPAATRPPSSSSSPPRPWPSSGSTPSATGRSSWMRPWSTTPSAPDASPGSATSPTASWSPRHWSPPGWPSIASGAGRYRP